jgi:hypothetical protein
VKLADTRPVPFRLPVLRLRRTTARAVVWAMVGLVPLQAIAACMLAALGPAHAHRTARTIVVLDDMRRASVHPVARLAHVATALGHFHAGTPERHQHALGDPSVVVLDDASQVAIDAAETSAGAASAAGIGLLPAALAWLAPACGAVQAACAAWSLQTHDPQPLERPPRAA